MIQTIIQLCLAGFVLCEDTADFHKIRYYEAGKSCYVNGTFYESCPTPEWKQKTVNRGKPWEQ